MKNFLLRVTAVLGVIAGGLLIWFLVVPFLGDIFTWMGNCLSGVLDKF